MIQSIPERSCLEQTVCYAVDVVHSVFQECYQSRMYFVDQHEGGSSNIRWCLDAITSSLKMLSLTNLGFNESDTAIKPPTMNVSITTKHTPVVYV